VLDGRKSTMPEMRVESRSTGKRVMAWMPDLPAVSACQFSRLPTPSAVTTPIPVTATVRLPKRSLLLISSSKHAGGRASQAGSIKAAPSPRR
jgi:hypothetical protein